MSKQKKSLKPYQLFLIGLGLLLINVFVINQLLPETFYSSLFVTLLNICVLVFWIVAIVNAIRNRINKPTITAATKAHNPHDKSDKASKKKIVLWSSISVLAIIGGGYFASEYRQNYLNDKIYSVNENINLSDFMLTVSSPSYTKPSLVIPQEKIAAFGDINTQEDCSKYPFLSWQTNNIDITSLDYDDNAYEKAHPSGRYCEWRNDSRKKIQAYIGDNERVSIDYKITANSTVDSKDIKVAVMLDSGRDLNNPATLFDYDSLLSTKYYPAFDYNYKPYSETQLGGSINKDITRNQNVSFDVRNSEKTIDLKVTYKGETRLVRISR